jgi:hypothetical protein
VTTTEKYERVALQAWIDAAVARPKYRVYRRKDEV